MTNTINEQLDIIDFSEVDTVLRGVHTIERVSLQDLAYRAIEGSLELSPAGIITGGLRLIFAEIFANLFLMQQLIFVAVLAAILKVITDSFQSKGVAELGFYVCYLVLVSIVFSSFGLAMMVVGDMVLNISNLVRVSIPIVISLVVMSGNFSGAYVFNALFLFAIDIINFIVRELFLPFIVFGATVHIINYLTESEILGKLSEGLQNLISWGLKSVAVIFIGVLTLQRISAPILNNIAINTARFTVNVVPVVGEVLSGAMDSVLHLASATKNGVIVAVILAVIYVCILPITKLVVLMLIYKFIAAILQPISDKRVVKCLDTTGSYLAVLLGICVLVAIMFSFALLLLVSF